MGGRTKTIWVYPGKSYVVDSSEPGHLEVRLPEADALKRIGDLARPGDQVMVFVDGYDRTPALRDIMLKGIEAQAKPKGARVEPVRETSRRR